MAPRPEEAGGIKKTRQCPFSVGIGANWRKKAALHCNTPRNGSKTKTNEPHTAAAALLCFVCEFVKYKGKQDGSG